MAQKFDGFNRSAPQGKPMTKTLLANRSADGPGNGATDTATGSALQGNGNASEVAPHAREVSIGGGIVPTRKASERLRRTETRRSKSDRLRKTREARRAEVVEKNDRKAEKMPETDAVATATTTTTEAARVSLRAGADAESLHDELSAWSAGGGLDAEKFARMIIEGTSEVLDRMQHQYEEIARQQIAKQEELGRLHARAVEKLTEVNKRESNFLVAVVGVLLLFAVIYIVK